jgi:hypothetical protein
MKGLIKVWSDAQLIIATVNRGKEIYGQIRNKREMPSKWYLGTKAEAYPKGVGENNVTVEMVEKRILLVLAKTLVAYEQLDAFYRYKIFFAIKFTR